LRWREPRRNLGKKRRLVKKGGVLASGDVGKMLAGMPEERIIDGDCTR